MRLFYCGLCFIAALSGCSESKPPLPKRYARLTVIYGQDQTFGIRYFWESPDEKTEAMSFEGLHEYFGIVPPVANELKVTPFDYKVIDHLIAAGWSLNGVSSTGEYSQDFQNMENAITNSAVTSYHFSK